MPSFHRDYGVGGHHKTTTLLTVLLVASAATAEVVYREVVDGKKVKLTRSALRIHPLEIEACERNVLSGSRVHSALKPPHFRGVSSVWSDDQARLKFVVVSPATVEWAEFEFVETVVGQAHSNCLRPPREAWYEIGGWTASDGGIESLLSAIHFVSYDPLFIALE